MIVFAASFLIFSGYAGFLSDRISKRPVIIASKVAEIVAMVLGMVGFLFYGTFGFRGMLVVLFLMGVQSAFFGPSKYGILPETIRPADLPRANGIFLMLTFLSIIFGMALAGWLLQARGQRTCVGGFAGVRVIAIVGTLTSLLVRPVPPANPQLKADWQAWLVPPDILRLLVKDISLLWAILVVSVFWMVGGMVQQGVNAVGKTQLGLNDAKTSMLGRVDRARHRHGLRDRRLPVSRSREPQRGHRRRDRHLCDDGPDEPPRRSQHQHLLGYYGSIPDADRDGRIYRACSSCRSRWRCNRVRRASRKAA